jgi:hypothetical protein
MHTNTPRKYSEYFGSCVPNASVVFSTEGDKEAAIRGMYYKAGDVGFVINTNLDSDDAISREFLETVQKNFRGEREFLNIERGIALKDGIAYGRRSEHSPFRSFVEPRNNVQSVYVTIHGGSHNIAPVRQIASNNPDACWLQLMHGENLTNKLAKKSQDKGYPFERKAYLFGL